MKRSWVFSLLLAVIVSSTLLVSACSSSAPSATTSGSPAPVAPATSAVPTTSTAPATSAPPATSPAAQQSGGPIKIGLLMEQTGFLAPVGKEGLQGAELAFDQAGLINGRPLQVITEDAASDPNTSVNMTRTLVEQDGVKLIVGPVYGDSADAMASYLDRVGVPDIKVAPSSNAEALSDTDYYSVCGIDQQVGWPIGVYAATVLGYKTATTTGQDSVGGRQFIAGFQGGFEANGGTVIQQTWSPPGTQDFSSFLLGAKQADCLVGWWPGAEDFAALSQYKSLGIKMPLLQPEDGGVTTDPLAQKQLAGANQGVIAGVLYDYVDNTPGNTDFVAAYKAKYGADPGAMAGAGYTSALVAIQALKAAGSDLSEDSIMKALDAVSIDTPRGHISFNSDRVANFDALVVKIGDNLQPEIQAKYQTEASKVGNAMQVTVTKVQ